MQLEETVDGFRVGGLRLFVWKRLELLGRLEEQLLDNEAGDLVDARARVRRATRPSLPSRRCSSERRIGLESLSAARRPVGTAPRDRCHAMNLVTSSLTIDSARSTSAARRERFSCTIVCRSSML